MIRDRQAISMIFSATKKMILDRLSSMLPTMPTKYIGLVIMSLL
jgi:hypothetical protein